MTAAARDIAATIRMLTELAVRESRALKRRSFKEIAEVAEKKRALADRLETASAQPRGALSDGARRDLARLVALLADNEARLASLRDSIARARVRLDAIVAAERSAGVYGAHGRGHFTPAPGAGRNA